jgi:hypothetical protein
MNALLSGLVLALAGSAPTAERPVAIVGVTVVDVETGRRLPDRTVVIRGGRIESVAAGRRPPRDARRVEGRGRFLIPGLWDMHVHTMPQATRPRALTTFLPLFVANGVLGVRDMGSEPGVVPAARERIAREGLVAPRLVTAGPILDGARPQWPRLSIAVSAPDDAERAVDEALATGAEFLKVYAGLSREAYLALSAVAARRGVRFAGHVPGSVTVAETAEAGQHSIEHLGEIQMACSAEAETIRRQLAAADSAPDGTAASRAAARRAARSRAAATLDPARCSSLLATLARKGTWVVPTLTVSHNAMDPARPDDPRLRYFEPETLAAWRADSRRPAPSATPLQGLREAGALDLVRRLASAGVPLLAGTDLTNFYTLPGFDLHLELALLVEAGLTPLQALQAATIGPARFLGRTDEFGTVAAGQRADLVVLEADPLRDIHNTARIAAVILDGRVFDRQGLDQLLAGVERVAAGAAAVP